MYLQEEESRNRVQAIYASEAEEHCVNKERRSNVFEAWDSGRGWLCRDILCHQGMHASLKAYTFIGCGVDPFWVTERMLQYILRYA